MPTAAPGPGGRVRDPSIFVRAESLYDAFTIAVRLAPSAVAAKTGYALGEILKGLLPGLVEMLVVVGVTTAVGGVAGGIIGFFFGGAGAAPGVVIGGEIGLNVGVAALTWLGLGFLAVAIAHGFGELWSTLLRGVEKAWAAPEYAPRQYPQEINKAAEEIANSVALLFLLILQGLVAWVLKRAAVKSTSAAIASVGKARIVGSQAAADVALAEALVELRNSKLGSGFADWVERNWNTLRDDPRLRVKPKTGGPAPSKIVSESPAQPVVQGRAASKKNLDVGRMKYRPSSGADLVPAPSKTTTILGNYSQDMSKIVTELGNQKSLDFSGKPGGFNVLNVPDELYKTPGQFWREYNQPWLAKAIQRGDEFVLASKPDPIFLNHPNGTLTGFGREIQYLVENGYRFDPITNTMVK